MRSKTVKSLGCGISGLLSGQGLSCSRDNVRVSRQGKSAWIMIEGNTVDAEAHGRDRKCKCFKFGLRRMCKPSVKWSLQDHSCLGLRKLTYPDQTVLSSAGRVWQHRYGILNRIPGSIAACNSKRPHRSSSPITGLPFPSVLHQTPLNAPARLVSTSSW